MKPVILDEQAELIIDSDIASVTTTNFCEWVDIGSNINDKNGMVKFSMANEEYSTYILSSATETKDDDGGNVVADHITLPSAFSAILYEAEKMWYK